LYMVSSNPNQKQRGFLPKQAEQTIVRCFHAFPFKNLDSGSATASSLPRTDKGKDASVEGSAKHKDESPQTTRTDKGKEGQSSSVEGSAKHKDESIGKSLSTKGLQELVEERRVIDGVNETMGKNMSGDSLKEKNAEEKKMQPPVGNGGSGPGYTWTQTLTELTVQIQVPKGTRGKDVECALSKSSIKVSLKQGNSIDPSVLLAGNFPMSESIQVSESDWSLSDGCVIIGLIKQRENWWKSVVVGHPEIDPQQVDSTKKINEYDPETQSAIRKLLHEKNQEHSLYNM
jgi:CS domain